MFVIVLLVLKVAVKIVIPVDEFTVTVEAEQVVLTEVSIDSNRHEGASVQVNADGLDLVLVAVVFLTVLHLELLDTTHPILRNTRQR